jgi:phosphoglycerate kinase
MLKTISALEDSKYSGKTVFMRIDFNVSIYNGSIDEDYRIRTSLPTIEYLSKRGAKVILASHLGRPRGW